MNKSYLFVLILSLVTLTVFESISQDCVTYCYTSPCSTIQLPCQGQAYRVPLNVTFVYNSNSSCSITSTDISNWNVALAYLNTEYSLAGIEFYIQNQQAICDNDLNVFSPNCLQDLFSNDFDGVLDGEWSSDFCSDVINVIIVDEYQQVDGLIGACSGCTSRTGVNFPTVESDYFVINRERINTPTLIHEMGHVFGLEHTFSDTYGVGGGDCEGDGIGDTSFDSGIGGCGLKPNSCDFIDNNGDGWHDQYFPSNMFINSFDWYNITQNFMSYGVNLNGDMDPSNDLECRDRFTTCQIKKINDKLLDCKKNVCGNSDNCEFGNAPAPVINSPYNTTYSNCETMPEISATADSYLRLSNCGGNSLRWDVYLNSINVSTEVGSTFDFNDNFTQVGTYTVCIYEVGDYSHFPGTSNTCFSEMNCFDVEITDCNNNCEIEIYSVDFLECPDSGSDPYLVEICFDGNSNALYDVFDNNGSTNGNSCCGNTSSGNHSLVSVPNCFTFDVIGQDNNYMITIQENGNAADCAETVSLPINLNSCSISCGSEAEGCISLCSNPTCNSDGTYDLEVSVNPTDPNVTGCSIGLFDGDAWSGGYGAPIIIDIIDNIQMGQCYTFTNLPAGFTAGINALVYDPLNLPCGGSGCTNTYEYNYYTAPVCNTNCSPPTNVQHAPFSGGSQINITWDNSNQDIHQVCLTNINTGVEDCETTPWEQGGWLFDVEDCSSYSYKVRRSCGGDYSDWVFGSFSTGNCPTCDFPPVTYSVVCNPEGGGYVVIVDVPDGGVYNYTDNYGNYADNTGVPFSIPGSPFGNTFYDPDGTPPTITLCQSSLPTCCEVVEVQPSDYASCSPICNPDYYYIPVDVTINCDQNPLSFNATGTAYTTCTTCSPPVSTITQNNNGCNNTGTVIRQWTYTDECGNSITQNQIITIVDNQVPFFIGPNNITINCGDNADDLSLTGDYQIATDNCTPNLTPTYTDDTNLGGCGGTGTITRTWSVTDDCNNTATDVQIITVEAAAGTFTCPANITILCDDSIDPTNTGNPIADLCGGGNAATYTDSGTLTAGGTITRTWSITDACGTPYTCNQIISMGACVATIDDPCSCTDPLNYLLNGEYFFHEVVEITSGTGEQWDMTNISSGQAYDAAGNVLPLAFTGIETPAGSGIYLFDFWHTSGVGFAADYTEVTSLMVLSVGNICTIPVLDVVCPATNDLGTYNCNTVGNIPPCPTDEASAEAVPYGMTIDDMPCGSIVVLCADDVAVDNCVAGNQTINRTVTVLDDLNANGMVDLGETTVDCIFTITIEADVEPPVVTCPASVTVECDASTDPVDTGTATATDNCDATPVITFADAVAVGACPQESVITRTWTATDACGNMITCDQIITVDDSISPVIVCPADVTVECDASILPADTGMATATDNCDAAPVIIFVDAVAAGACAQESVITRTWTATDACGNAITCDQIITVEDTTPPVIVCPADVTVECDASILPADTGMATATDNCDAASVITFADVVAAGACPQESVITRTWTATDDCGNAITCDQIITVEDTTPPVITCPADVAVSCDASTDPADTGVATATDNCDAAPVITFEDISTETGEGCGQFTYSISRTWIATDGCGNLTTCVQNISVADTEPPVISCPLDQTLTCFETLPAPFSNAADFIAAGGAISDNCTIELSDFTVFTQNSDNGGDNCPGNTRLVTRTYFVQDACGNTITCEQTFTYLESTQGPVITSILPACYKYCASLANPMESDITYETDCSFGATVNIEGPTFIGQENCSGSIVRYTYTVTDDCGRISDPVVRDFIVQNDGPSIQCPSFNLLLDCGDENNSDYIDAHVGLVTANASCGSDVTITHSPQNFSNITCNTPTIVTFTATDACGLTATCTTTINISDNTLPVITSVYEDGICNEAVCGSNLNFWYNAWKDKVMEGLSATDDCDSNVSISPQGPNGPSQNCPNETTETVVNFVATDNCGNTSYISYSFYVTALDTPEPPQVSNISGLIHTEEMEAVEDVEVYLSGGATYFEMFVTANDGMYAFNNVPLEQNYSITPLLDQFPMNGVSSYDLILIAQHVLNVNLLDSPYKMIAADINRSGSITTLDLVELRKMILYINSEFTNNTSWRFVDADFIFPYSDNPFATTFPEVVDINGLLEDVDHDFVGVKIGDVNNTAIPNNLLGGDDRTFNEQLHFDIEDVDLKEGEMYEVVFRSSDFNMLKGYQYTLSFDVNQLEFVSLDVNDLPGLSQDNFGLSLLESGAITTSWTSEMPLSLDASTDLFRMTFKAKRATRLSNTLQISSDFTKAEAYDVNTSNGQLNLLEVSLRFDTANEFTLFQNIPNPFVDETAIGFILPEASFATLTIYDVSGRVLKVVEADYKKGFNQIRVQSSDLVQGAMYYELLTPLYKGVRKMVLIR